jgi:hypothetical protein
MLSIVRTLVAVPASGVMIVNAGIGMGTALRALIRPAEELGGGLSVALLWRALVVLVFFFAMSHLTL